MSIRCIILAIAFIAAATMPLMFIAQAIATSPLLVAALTIIVSRLGGRPCPTCIGSKCHLLATIYGVLND